MGDSGEKGENFEVVIFAIKSFLSIQSLTGSSIVLFLSVCVAYLGKKRTNLEILHMEIFEAFVGRYESHFLTD